MNRFCSCRILLLMSVACILIQLAKCDNESGNETVEIHALSHTQTLSENEVKQEKIANIDIDNVEEKVNSGEGQNNNKIPIPPKEKSDMDAEGNPAPEETLVERADVDADADKALGVSVNRESLGSGAQNENEVVETNADSDSESVSGEKSPGECIDKVGLITQNELELCKSVSLQTVQEGLQKLLQDPNQAFTGKDYVCTLLNLVQRSVEYSVKISTLENTLEETEAQLKASQQGASDDMKPLKIIQESTIQRLSQMESGIKEVREVSKISKMSQAEDEAKTREISITSIKTIKSRLDLLDQKSKKVEEDMEIQGASQTAIQEQLANFQDQLQLVSTTSRDNSQEISHLANVTNERFEKFKDIYLTKRNETLGRITRLEDGFETLPSKMKEIQGNLDKNTKDISSLFESLGKFDINSLVEKLDELLENLAKNTKNVENLRDIEIPQKIKAFENFRDVVLQKFGKLQSQVEKLPEIYEKVEGNIKVISSLSESSKRIEKLEKLELETSFEKLKELEEKSERNQQDLLFVKLYLNETFNNAGKQAEALEATLEDLNRRGAKWDEISTISTQLAELASRTSKTELEIVDKIVDLSSSFSSLKSSFTNQSTEMERISTLSADFQRALTLLESLDNMTQKFDEYREKVNGDLKDAENDLKTMLQAPFKLIEVLENKMNSERVGHSKLKSSLEEIDERFIALNEEFMVEKSLLKKMEGDFSARVRMESMRAKSAEAQLTTIVMSESSRAKQMDEQLQEQLDSILSQISDEVSRAITTESGLLGNINEELKRASEREEELHKLVVQVEVKMSKLSEELAVAADTRGKGKPDLELIVDSHGKKLLEVESTLKAKISAETKRATKVEGELREEIENFDTYFRREFHNLESNFSDHGSQFEEMKEAHVGNFSFVGERLEHVGLKIENEVSRMEELAMENLRVFSTHLLSLAGEMDGKLEIENRTLNSRIEKMEKDLRRCCTSSGSGWPNWPSSWRPTPNSNASRPSSTTTTTTTGGNSPSVFNRVLGFFGGSRRNSTAGRPKKDKKLLERAEPEELEPVGAETETEDETDAELKMSEKLRVDNLFDEEEELVSSLSRAPSGKVGVGKGRRESERAYPVLVQRSNSKVRNIYG